MDNNPKHPREVAMGKVIERMQNDPKEAARRIYHHIYALERRRDAHTYMPDYILTIAALKMAVKLLEQGVPVSHEIKANLVFIDEQLDSGYIDLDHICDEDEFDLVYTAIKEYKERRGITDEKEKEQNNGT